MSKINRNTKQKAIIDSEVQKTSTFFTSDYIFNKVKNKDKKIGIATIYRFLKELRIKGKLHSYICNNKIIYSKSHHNHSHFICEKCNSIEHIKIEKLDFIKKYLSKNICHFQLDLHGICEKCKIKFN